MAGAIWHGFYPGYYLAFLLGSFCTQFSRLVRRKLRPHALAAGTWVKAGYDTVGWAGSALILGYGSVPFTLLRLDQTLDVWSALHHCVPWLIFPGLVLLMVLPSPERVRRKTA